MRYIILLLFFFCVEFAFSQSLEEDLQNYVCNCFQKESINSEFNIDLIKTCFDFSDSESVSIVEKMIARDIDTTKIGKDEGYQNDYEVGYEF